MHRYEEVFRLADSVASDTKLSREAENMFGAFRFAANDFHPVRSLKTYYSQTCTSFIPLQPLPLSPTFLACNLGLPRLSAEDFACDAGFRNGGAVGPHTAGANTTNGEAVRRDINTPH